MNDKIPQSLVYQHQTNEPSRSETKQCPACQAPLEPESKYCPACGHSLMETMVDTSLEYELVERNILAPPVLPKSSDSEKISLLHPEPENSQAKIISTPEPKQDVLYCNHCGQQLTLEHQYCYRCGTCMGNTSPVFRLQVVSKDHQTNVIELSASEVTIGKLPECDLVLSEDDYVSRRHARLFRSDGMIFLEDTGSANGTYLRVRRPIVLEPDDEILIGTTVLRLEDRA